MIALTFAVVTVGGGGIAFLLLRLLGQKTAPALIIAVSLAQIGEFSFILADLGIGLGILRQSARDLILGASILSILINPLLFALAVRWTAEEEAAADPDKHHTAPEPTSLTGHAVLVGYGRVGSLIAQALQAQLPLLVIEEAPVKIAGLEHIRGNAAKDEVLAAANLAGARLLFVAIPEAFEAGQIVQQARAANPKLKIIARAHFDAEVAHLARLGADHVVMGEREIAAAMLGFASP